MTSAYRFYVIGDDYRILANEVGTFAADADAIGHGTSYLATVAAWTPARAAAPLGRGDD